jgi:hypothetical protein
MPQRAPRLDDSIIPLKQESEPDVFDDDLYEGDVYEEPSVVWRWIKRIVLLGVLAAVGRDVRDRGRRRDRQARQPAHASGAQRGGGRKAAA